MHSPTVHRVMTRTQLRVVGACASVPLLALLTGCSWLGLGEGGDPADDFSPALCSEVWVEGQPLPGTYVYCLDDDGGQVYDSACSCTYRGQSIGRRLFTHGNLLGLDGKRIVDESDETATTALRRQCWPKHL
jgi:hypothetical protein